MALENTQTSVTVTGNGVVRSIPIYFPILDAEHLVLSGYRADQTPFTFVMGTNYTVALNPSASGGAATATVTLTQPLASGWTLTVERNVPIVQTAVFDNQAGLQPKTVENRLDYLTMIAQQLDRELLARLEIPPGMSAAQVEQLLVNNAATLTALQTQVNAKASAADLAAAIANLNMKANIESPALTGAARSSTPALNDNSTRIANTGWVKGQNYAPLESPDFTGNPTAPTQPVGDRSARIANTEFVAAGLATKAKNALATQEADGLMSAEDKRKLDQYAGGEIDVGTIDGLEEALDKKADKTALATETTARQNADAALQTQVNAKADAADLANLATKPELTAEATTRQNADASLQTQINAKASTATATPSANGLMSAADKTKLDGLDPSGGSGLPPGGNANDILAKDGANAAGWKTPAQVAETLPKASAAAFGVARADGTTIVSSGGVLTAVGGGGGGTSNHAALEGRDLPDQHPAPAINVGTEENPVGLDVKLADMDAATAAKADASALAAETSARSAADADLQSQINALGQGGGVTVHNDLDGRDAADSHPAAAIAYDAGNTLAQKLAAMDAATAGKANALHTQTISTIDDLQPALDAKAPLASPALTGTPTAPTAGSTTNTTQVATTQFVQTVASTKANLASPALTGTPTVPTATAGTNTTQAASTQFVQTAVSGAIKRVTGTLTAAGWAGSAAPWTQTLTMANDVKGMAGLAAGATLAQYEAAANAGIWVSARTASNITFSAAFEKPTVNIPVEYVGA